VIIYGLHGVVALSIRVMYSIVLRFVCLEAMMRFERFWMFAAILVLFGNRAEALASGSESGEGKSRRLALDGFPICSLPLYAETGDE